MATREKAITVKYARALIGQKVIIRTTDMVYGPNGDTTLTMVKNSQLIIDNAGWKRVVYLRSVRHLAPFTG